MKLFVKNIRKDGKLTVVYAYSNGVCLTKIITKEQLQKDREKGYGE